MYELHVKHILTSYTNVKYELNSQINERQQDATLFAPLISTSPRSSARPLSLPAQYRPLREVLESARRTATARVRNGETNAKGVVFLNCALARIDALLSGADTDRAVLEAAKKSVEEVSLILAEVYREEHGEDIDLSLPTGNFGGKEHGRGEGADDVTGRNSRMGTETGPEAQSDLSADFSAFDGTMEGLDMLNDLGMGSVGMDVDFNAYMQGQPMDTESGFHFGRSPEWFYDLNSWAATGNFGNLGAGYNPFAT
jgi:hypothetical protein